MIDKRNKACPMCHRLARDSAARCDDCMYEFGQPVEIVLRKLLRQRRMQGGLVGMMIVVLLSAIGILMATGSFVVFLMIAPLVMKIMHSGNRLYLTQVSIGVMRERQHLLPVARVVKK